MKSGFASLLLFVSAALSAQHSEYLTFQNSIADLGTVDEQGGAVVHRFEFTNTANRPIRLVGVKPSCGCTTPDYSREPVAAGARGYIDARFDPKGRPGFFTKTLAVVTDFDSAPITLTLRGTVSGNNFSGLRESSGSLRMASSSFNMGKVWLVDEWRWKEFEVVNTGDAAVDVQQIVAPVFSKVEVRPMSIEPGRKAMVRVGYNGKLKDAYGFQTDNIELVTNDVDVPRKSFALYATLEEFFPKLTADEIARAPRLTLTESILDLGRLASSASIEKTITLTNIGKKELSIRAVQANCKCLVATVSANQIGAGKQASLVVRFIPEQRSGTQQKFVTIYTNDPANPVQRVEVMAYVE